MDQKVIVQILRSPSGGTRKHVYDILETLANEEFKQIFFSNFDHADYLLEGHNNLELVHVPIEEQPSPKDLVNLWRIYRHLAHRKVDVVHGHGAKGGLYARILAFPLRAKAVYTPHGGSLHRVYGRVKNFLYDVTELVLIPFTDVLLFESRFSRDTFARNVLAVPQKTLVNYNGIEVPDLGSPRIYRPGEQIDIVSFGLLRHLKGHDIALRTSKLLKDARIPFSYTIYGKGEELENLLNLRKELGLEAQVTIRDFTSEVYREMLKHHFVFHPSRHEALPYVPIEGMMLGLPAIVSKVGGMTEIVDARCGFVSPVNSPLEYAHIFQDIYYGRADMPSLSRSAKLKARRLFSKATMIQTLAEIYRR